MSSATIIDVAPTTPPADRATGSAERQGLRPLAIEWVAALATVTSFFALALIRCGMTDTPYHLATARVAHESGHWPTTNTFSYTFPDYPLYQQYPVYQELLYRVYNTWSWEGLSILHLTAYAVIFFLWIAWGGGWRMAVILSLPTMILVLGLRERMVLRPDILSMAYFTGTLLIIDCVRRGWQWTALALPLIQFLWVNSHQMFWLGLVIQTSFLIHLVILKRMNGRFSLAVADAHIPIGMMAIALATSVLACFLSPLGVHIVEVPLQTMGSLRLHKADVDEFAGFYSSIQATWLVAAASVFAAIALGLSRKRWQPFEVFVLGLTAAMTIGAIRGVPYYVGICVGLLGRELRIWLGSNRPVIPHIVRVASAILALGLATQVVWHRWIQPSRTLGGSQFGVGRVLGAWPDETMRFVKDHPPPGNLLNLGWYIGNPIVMELYPKHRVFVDPRFEAYPRAFLTTAIAAERDPIVLDRLIDEYEPLWIIAEIRKRSICQQVARLLSMKDWEPVFLDPVCVVLVRTTSETRPYVADHSIRLETFDPPGLLFDEPDLLALQQLRLAAFFADLGKLERARQWLEQARTKTSETYAIREALAVLFADHPELE